MYMYNTVQYVRRIIFLSTIIIIIFFFSVIFFKVHLCIEITNPYR